MKERFIDWIGKLGSLSPEQAAALEEILQEKHVAKNQFLLKPGQKADKIYFIIEGAFRSYFLKGGEEITDYFFFENSFATDYVSLYGDLPTDFYLKAMEDSQLVAYKREDLISLGNKYPIFESFGRIHAEKAFLEIEERMRILQHESLMGKYTYLINKFPKLFLRVPQHQIASYLGVKAESLSRIKKQARSDSNS